ncbi:MAG: NAD(P)/FAD-dependent oxidoreductase [Acidobacteria bacterium]|nr:NAD(P)/FAD-dependent oxidoreductase [Acidobacteriota bacterium]
MKRVVVIGGGLAGLAAAYDLVRAGHQVTMLEAAPSFGGLASSFRLEGFPVERFYHFICRSDDHLVNLVRELGLESKLHWQATRTSFYFNGRYYKFGSPIDLLKFTAVPFFQRLRFGFHVLHSRYRSQWRSLDAIPAKPWLIKHIGQRAYDVIWHPLLKVKFGDDHDRISAAWIWHRIWRVARSRKSMLAGESFGYLEHGSATLVDALVDWLKAQPNATVLTGVRVEPLTTTGDRVTEVRTDQGTFPCDAVVSTVALPSLDRLVPGRTDEYFDKVRQVRYIGVVCALFSLKRSLSTNFWTNINDPRISFNGVIEQTNLNDNMRQKGLHVIYVPFYLPTDDPRYSATDEALFDEYTAMLKLVQPDFDRSWVKEFHVFRAPHAQALFVTNFAPLMPAHRTPVTNLFVTDSTQFYPEDRTLSAAIAQGKKVAAMIDGDPAPQ